MYESQKGQQKATRRGSQWIDWIRKGKPYYATSGVEEIRKSCNADWLLCLIISCQLQLKDHPFQVWDLSILKKETSADADAVLICTDGEHRKLITQEIYAVHYPDILNFPFPEGLSLFCKRDNGATIIYLPSEH